MTEQISDINSSDSTKWFINNKIKTKKSLAKFLDQEKLKKVLDKNLKHFHSKKYNGKIKYEDWDYDNFHEITNLKYEILSCFCPSHLDIEEFEIICTDGIIHEYNNEINFLDIFDLLNYADLEVTPLCDLHLNKGNIPNKSTDISSFYPNMIYINIKFDNKNSYLLKMVDLNNDRAMYLGDFLVVKKHSEKFNKKFFISILMDSLNTFIPQCPPWNYIAFNSHAVSLLPYAKSNDSVRSGVDYRFIKDVSFLKEYMRESKKVIKQIIKSSKPEDGTFKSDIYEYVLDIPSDYANVMFSEKPLIKSSNKSFWDDWPYE